jgi:hypothetical protein
MTIRGENLGFGATLAGPTIDKRAFKVWIGDAATDSVDWQSKNDLRTRLPQGLEVGTYDVSVVTPEGQWLTLPAALTVTEDDLTPGAAASPNEVQVAVPAETPSPPVPPSSVPPAEIPPNEVPPPDTQKKGPPPSDCGDGLIEGVEVCDPGAPLAESCSSQGFVSGALVCAADCTSFDTSACTTPIATAADLQAAVDAALAAAGHEVISVPPGNYDFSAAPLVINETSAACGGKDCGITLRADGAGTRLFGSANGAVSVYQADCVIEGFTLVGGGVGVRLMPSASNSTLRNLLIEGTTSIGMRVQSEANVIENNVFLYSGSLRGTAISVTGNSNTLSRNVIQGAYLLGVFFGANNIRFDHNTVRLTGTGGIGLSLLNAGDFVARNNLNVGVQESQACAMIASSVAELSSHNNEVGHGGTCTAAALRDLSLPVTFDGTDSCLALPSALVDAGVDLSEAYLGAAPDIGARESGENGCP